MPIKQIPWFKGLTIAIEVVLTILISGLLCGIAGYFLWSSNPIFGFVFGMSIGFFLGLIFAFWAIIKIYGK
ncbi:MAG: prominin family protein [Euryarchaeota archaeon]|nr:prominin family protein [Euryarchaeota archaeon]